MSTALAPVAVSPLIKGARWSFLLAGIAYGTVRYKTLSAQEKRRLEELERTRPEREARMKAEKEKKSLEDLEELNNLFSVHK